MFFTWESSLDTGIEIIDEQHRRIVDYINALHNAISTKDIDMVSNILDQLIDYTVSHFSFEESLMQNHGYMHTEAHKKVHDMFTARIQNYRKELDEGKDISRKLLNDLKVWLTSHIKSEDSDYVKVVKTKVEKSWVSKTLGKFFKK